MFFKGIKRKSAQKHIIKALKTNEVKHGGKIKSLAILVDATVYKDFPFFNELTEVFGISKGSIEVLYYHSDKKVAEQFSETIYTSSQLGFNGVVKNDDVVHFIEKSYDALLNFYNEDNLMLNLVSAKSKAKFKIGFTGVKEGLNDFSIATELNNISVFTFELKKYLSILNKI